MEASQARGIRGGEFDNQQLVLEIAKLRAERAKLLGFDSHAAAVTADETAKNPQNVADMLTRLAKPAARNAREEQADLKAQADHDIESHDWSYYSEKVRQAKYEVDTAAMRPYFEAERVLQDGVFYAATKVYGVTFTERDDIPAYHPDVRVFEVHNEDGSPVGLYTLDLYTRDSKRGGAWMNSLIAQNDLLDHPVVVTNNLNVPKPAAGEPTLLTYDEVNTLFHEFGHALHGLFARVTYPKFAGTNTYRDFVEFPSQVNEMWMLWPEVLENYAKHYQTGEPMPAEFVERIQASKAFNEGFATSEYLAAACLDQAWHRLGPDDVVTDVAAFEAAALAEAGLDNPAVPTRYSSTYFQHVFATSSYDAAYYSYIWSEVLDADTVEWFKENGGLTRANGDRFRERLLGVGGKRDPLEAYRDFRGRDADIQPLLDTTRTGRGLALRSLAPEAVEGCASVAEQVLRGQLPQRVREGRSERAIIGEDLELDPAIEVAVLQRAQDRDEVERAVAGKLPVHPGAWLLRTVADLDPEDAIPVPHKLVDEELWRPRVPCVDEDIDVRRPGLVDQLERLRHRGCEAAAGAGPEHLESEPGAALAGCLTTAAQALHHPSTSLAGRHRTRRSGVAGDRDRVERCEAADAVAHPLDPLAGVPRQ